MKKLIFAALLASAALLYFSCQKDDNPLPSANEEMLIGQIINASTVEAVSVADLPSSIAGYVKQYHSPLGVDLAFRAGQHGYEIFLESGLCLYFDQHGNHLNHDGMHGDMGNHHGGGDPGINFCLAGDTLDIAAQPQSALNHISANYPGVTVVTVVLKPSGNLAVEISNGIILMFGPSGNYFHECDMQGTGGHGHEHGGMGGPGRHCEPDGGMGGGHHGGMGQGHGTHTGAGGHNGNMGNHSGPNEPCWGGTSISIDDLPTAITTYINANHTGATVEHVMQTFNGNYFLRLSDCARLVFDEEGNILFHSGD